MQRPEMTSQPTLATILLAEDDPGHARLVERNLRRGGIGNEIVHVTDGRAALDFVRGTGQYANTKRPDRVLVLLDLNMPVMDGFGVLDALKNDPSTQRIPVIVLTTTDVPEDVDRCYELGCNTFITKPVEYEAFTDAVRRLGSLVSVMAIPSNPGTQQACRA